MEYYQKVIDYLDTGIEWLNTQTSQIQVFFVEHPIAKYYSIGLLISIVMYGFYLELNPRIGGIFRRPDANGQTRFNLRGILPVLKYTFTSVSFWKPSDWDLNIILFTNFWASIFTLLMLQ